MIEVFSREGKKSYFGNDYCEQINKLKSGDLIQINQAFDFLWRGSKKDHFDLYLPVFEKELAIVLEPCILCGDCRWKCDFKEIADNKEKYPKFYKNLNYYDIVTPLTPCVEIINKDNKKLYLECELFSKCVERKWIKIISKDPIK